MFALGGLLFCKQYGFLPPEGDFFYKNKWYLRPEGNFKKGVNFFPWWWFVCKTYGFLPLEGVNKKLFLIIRPSLKDLDISSLSFFITLRTKLKPWPAIGCIECKPSPKINILFLKYLVFKFKLIGKDWIFSIFIILGFLNIFLTFKAKIFFNNLFSLMKYAVLILQTTENIFLLKGKIASGPSFRKNWLTLFPYVHGTGLSESLSILTVSRQRAKEYLPTSSNCSKKPSAK